MTKKFVNTKLDLDRIEIDVEFFGLSTASLTPLDRMDDLTAYMKNAIDVFVMKNSERLIREFQSGMDRGVHYRLDTNTFTAREYLSNMGYAQYTDRCGNEIKRPKDFKYAVGDVVMVTKPNDEEESGLGIILGCIGEHEVRTDWCGMTAIDEIRFATRENLLNAKTEYGKRIANYLGVKE